MVFRRRMALSPINSIKHILDADGTATGAVSNKVTIANAVPNVDPDTFTPGDVRVGSKINGIFLSIFGIGTTGAPVNGSFNWYINKEHAGQDAIQATPGNTGISPVRNQIFHEEKGLVGSGDGTAMAFKGVVAIPRGMRRMREGDKINIFLKAQDDTEPIQFCVKAIYKSYF